MSPSHLVCLLFLTLSACPPQIVSPLLTCPHFPVLFLPVWPHFACLPGTYVWPPSHLGCLSASISTSLPAPSHLVCLPLSNPVCLSPSHLICLSPLSCLSAPIFSCLLASITLSVCPYLLFSACLHHLVCLPLSPLVCLPQSPCLSAPISSCLPASITLFVCPPDSSIACLPTDQIPSSPSDNIYICSLKTTVSKAHEKKVSDFRDYSFWPLDSKTLGIFPISFFVTVILHFLDFRFLTVYIWLFVFDEQSLANFYWANSS